MSSVWVPYPINCYRAFDMSEKAVAEAKAFSTNFKQPADDDDTGKTPEKLVKTKGAAPLAVASAFIREGFREKNFVQYDVTVSGVAVGEDKVFLPTIMVFTDYRRSADKVSNIELVRLVLDRENLADEESRKANYLPCGDLAAQARDNGSQQIRLHLGNQAKTERMHPVEDVGATARSGHPCSTGSALAINGAVILGGVLAYLDTAGLREVLPPGYAWVPIALGAGNVALRLITTGPVGRNG